VLSLIACIEALCLNNLVNKEQQKFFPSSGKSGNIGLFLLITTD